MNRRDFLLAGGAGLATSFAPAGGDRRRPGEPFALDFAPHFGMFRHHAPGGPLEELAFLHDQGFRALEDNGMARRPVALQKKIAAEMERLGMRMGVFVAHADFGQPTFASGKQEHRDKVLADMRAAVEVAERVRAKWCTVVPGTVDHRQDLGYQTANVVDLLRRCAEICEPAGLTMVLEPLNFRDHPGLFLTKIAQAFQICRAVQSPACKILDDLYHQQVTEGNLIPNIDRAYDEIAYFQVGDNPGRKEPTTGEIHYGNVFRHLKAKGYGGIVGMEHGNSKAGKEGEQAVLAAYRAVDPR